ncbi:hypothetical protein JHK82_052007 [Glycine max]|uniref:Uncharacterized protein n=1 Tax=Glycine soja TaxID=3848 RepID=A0A0B2P1H5_GLYSO|nr:hypothetical protein JHK86_051842 [Glycine max]KAG4926204.1 hypothetical protein JHK87_051744 [Glycine soja]KAG4937778.1 hypothetical protein JHK85_052697 [Glycine max]KAG5093229.1 hypothetical protein JHK82_052007 [Glycine max]KAG5096297.1 hypothetical protein JHK84_051885 [Glycine max]
MVKIRMTLAARWFGLGMSVVPLWSGGVGVWCRRGLGNGVVLGRDWRNELWEMVTEGHSGKRMSFVKVIATTIIHVLWEKKVQCS